MFSILRKALGGTGVSSIASDLDRYGAAKVPGLLVTR
jgi:hypothetical protein